MISHRYPLGVSLPWTSPSSLGIWTLSDPSSVIVSILFFMFLSVFPIHQNYFCDCKFILLPTVVHKIYLVRSAVCGGPYHLNHIPWVLFLVRQDLVRLPHLFWINWLTPEYMSSPSLPHVFQICFCLIPTGKRMPGMHPWLPPGIWYYILVLHPSSIWDGSTWTVPDPPLLYQLQWFHHYAPQHQCCFISTCGSRVPICTCRVYRYIDASFSRGWHEVGT